MSILQLTVITINTSNGPLHLRHTRAGKAVDKRCSFGKLCY